MDYLEKLFQKYLDNTYLIDIEGNTFYGYDILSQLDLVAYKQAFEEWKNNRKNELMEKAQNMLRKFNIESRFVALKKQYKNGKLNLFLGAGISIPSGYKSWTEMLLYLKSQTDKISDEEMNQLIKEGKYEEAAQLLYDKLGYIRFNELLENEYNLDKEEIKGSVNFLPLTFQESHIITTNFDNIIKNIYEDNGLKFNETIFGFEDEEIGRLLNSENRILIKLHGKASNPKKRILTQEEYNKFYSENNLKLTLEKIMNNSLLFIGCSLNSDRTIQTMKEIIKENPSLPRHYAFLQLNEKDNREQIEENLAKANIFPIWYDDEHDESIEAFLLLLTKGVLYDN